MPRKQKTANKRETLVTARMLRGYDVGTVAKLLGVTRRYVEMLEQGVRSPSLAIALKLESLYGVPVSLLFPDLQADRATGTDGR